ncbi:MAG: DUF1501 domain-containing protein, partial [Verrucomicrobiae bacterium]|nr:DUF1501 domain-containing protein [Verrucomicrobiae bacterium]
MMPFPGRSRREFLSRFGLGFGGIALADLMSRQAAMANEGEGGILPATHFPAKAKRVIYLFMSGGPSQMDTFDHKPLLNEKHGEQLPDSVRQGQRLTGMSGNQTSLPLAGSPFAFSRHGECGAWVSDILPHTAKVVDDLCFVRSLHTEAINHDPAITFFQTGSQISGRPSIGSWLSYGLGADNENLPGFVVLTSVGGGQSQPIASRQWHSGFLPSRFQGVQFHSKGNPVLYVGNPAGVTRQRQRDVIDTVSAL